MASALEVALSSYLHVSQLIAAILILYNNNCEYCIFFGSIIILVLLLRNCENIIS
jgi:hypothetical protein